MPDQMIQVGGISISRAELEAGIIGAAMMRASAKKNNAPLDEQDVRALFANAMADGTLVLSEARDLFLVYVMYEDRMTAAGREALYSVLQAHVAEAAPRMGTTVKDATDLFYVYHHDHSRMTPDARKEMLEFLSRSFM